MVPVIGRVNNQPVIILRATPHLTLVICTAEPTPITVELTTLLVLTGPPIMEDAKIISAELVCDVKE